VIILVLAVINVFGVRLGALVQNVFTTAKTAALLGLVILGVLFGPTSRRFTRTLARISGTGLAGARSIRCRWAWAARWRWLAC